MTGPPYGAPTVWTFSYGASNGLAYTEIAAATGAAKASAAGKRPLACSSLGALVVAATVVWKTWWLSLGGE
jgi:hypothetical protein